MLQQEFKALVSRHLDNQELANQLWTKIEMAYSQPERFFHNLSHLEQLITALQPYKSQAEDWDTLLFAVYYHDLIYDVVEYVTDNNNEDKSADQAAKDLESIRFPAEKIERCRQHILATKKHQQLPDKDTNLLTDADLSVLGQSWEIYDAYRKNIRKEYIIYPDPIYHAGRTKVLQQFLQMPSLYKTPGFQERFETAAKQNIRRELEIISLS